MSPCTVAAALREARDCIDALDARVLLCHVTGRDMAYLAAHPEAEVHPADHLRFEALVTRRARGEPVAYLTGEREFYGRSFHVGSDVLIPRPETELLVDLALERLPRDRGARLLDLGTGSGCLAITIASERSRCEVLAVDQSPAALAIARRNALEHAVGNVAFLQSDWYSGLQPGEHFDMIVANPPYVAAGDPHLGRGDLRFEPREALVAGSDGLEAIRAITRGASRHLSPGGWLLLEHGYDQAAQVRRLLADSAFQQVFSARDLAGIERVSGGRLTLTQQGPYNS
jgi:release factor glutamine methyltransferase